MEDKAMKTNTIPTAATAVAAHPSATRNHEGGLAFEMGAKVRLYTRVTTSLGGEKKFYQEGQKHDSAIKADIALVAQTDPEFILRLAAYVRQVLNLRSVPVLILVEAASIAACKPYVRRWTPQIVRRADELAEVVACWIIQHGQIGGRGEAGGTHAFPNSLKKGLTDAFGHFDEYQLAKYDREGAVKLGDVLRITHAKPEGEYQAALFRYLLSEEIDGERLPLLAAKARLVRKDTFDAEAQELATAAHATWEVLISKFGSSKETWEAVIPMMGYMALLRNLRNFLDKGVEMAPVLARLADADEVRRSKQLPFRFFSAYREIEKLQGKPGVGAVLSAITQALEKSVANLPRLTGTSFIAADNSGSMNAALSEHSSVRYADVANLLGAIAHQMSDDAIVGSFACRFATVQLNPRDSILTNMGKIAKVSVGSSTNAYLCVKWLREQNHRVDRIVILSDMQCYDSRRGYGESLSQELLRYRSRVNPRVQVHSVDLAGYGTSQFPEDTPGLALWAGWSERALEAMSLFEEDKAQAVDRIARWVPRGHEEGSDVESP
jgi:60 kDa SS-A/Ro ribonucleoprotein